MSDRGIHQALLLKDPLALKGIGDHLNLEVTTATGNGCFSSRNGGLNRLLDFLFYGHRPSSPWPNLELALDPPYFRRDTGPSEVPQPPALRIPNRVTGPLDLDEGQPSGDGFSSYNCGRPRQDHQVR